MDLLKALFVCYQHHMPFIAHRQMNCLIIDSLLKLRFCFHQNGEVTQQSIREQIELLTKANENDTAYLNVVAGSREIDNGTLSNNQKHCIHQKCQLLCVALNLALENMNG
jgi:hypothetical protein